MDFTNDPAGVIALLDQLRSSQAWQDVAVPVGPALTTSGGLSEPSTQPASEPTASNSVASLLSQLHATPTWSTQQPPSNPESNRSAISPSPPPESTPPPPFVPSEHPRKKDVKSYTFHQALPHLAQLAEDPHFVATVIQMKKDQDALERQLWEERLAIQSKYEDKVKVANTKANITGTSISKHEANMITDGYKNELQKFDRDRALPAWDGLISKQQTALAACNVPAMFPTSDKVDRERQQRVMQVVEGIIGSGS